MTGRARIAAAIVAAAALALSPAVPPAAAQDEGAQPAVPDPGAPRLVISGRDLRMNLAGVIPLRVGCFGRGGYCAGRLEARIIEPIRARNRTYAPFVLARGGFGVPAARSQLLRLRFYPRARYLVRAAGTIDVVIVGRMGSRTWQRLIAVYVSPSRRLR